MRFEFLEPFMFFAQTLGKHDDDRQNYNSGCKMCCQLNLPEPGAWDKTEHALAFVFLQKPSVRLPSRLKKPSTSLEILKFAGWNSSD